MRVLAAVLLLSLAGCAAPPAPSASDAPRPAPLLGDLSADQAEALGALGVPVLVPGDPGLFRLDRFEAERGAYGTFYLLAYRRADGVCVEVSGSDDGLGGPPLPLVSTEARIADLGRTVRIYQAADDPGATSAQTWGPGTVVSENISLDGMVALVLSSDQNGCRPVSLAEGAAFVSRLRLLPASSGPASGAALGAFAPADDVLADYNAASSPEAAAQAVARRYADEADAVEVRVLEQTAYAATALVTATGLRDDSVRDERLRLTYSPAGGTWELVGAARQVRCWPGRGHEDWGADRCL